MVNLPPDNQEFSVFQRNIYIISSAPEVEALYSSEHRYTYKYT
jgi:hypothetical protein